MKRSLKWIASFTSCLLLCASFSAAAEDARYKIKFKKGQTAAGERLVEKLNGKRAKRRGRAARRLAAAELSPGQLRKLRASGLVESIEEDQRRYLAAERTPYGIAMVQSSALLADTASPRKVCIIDSGYDDTHEDLPGLNSNRVAGYSGVSGELWHEDGNGHGTHVAGTIAALGGNNTGVVGVHTGSSLSLHIIKVFNNNGNWAYSSDLIDAVDRCVAAGSDVISMSLSGGGFSNFENNAFQSAADAGVILVAAASNSGSSSYAYPASYDSVISVAAINDQEQRASFSQYNNQVELAAPGVAVESTLPGDTYASWSGTSMATPHVSAVAAVLWGVNPGCTAADIRYHLGASAKDLGTPGRDVEYGYGLVQLQDADASIKQNGCAKPITTLTNGQTITGISESQGSIFDFRLTIEEGATDLMVTIDGANGDADLYVRYGNEPTLSEWDCRPYIGGSNEQCSFNPPQAGEYYGMIRAYSSFSNVSLSASWNGPVEPPTNQPPVAVISASTTSGPAPLAVDFDSGESTDDKLITARQWEFGDGATATNLISPSHVYQAPGTYTATLTVLDEEGESSTDEIVIQVNENQAPTAQLTVDGELEVGQTLTFDARSSNDTDGEIVSWSWAFGDTNSGTGETATHAYASAGNYTVELTVSDNNGAVGTADLQVSIADAPPPPAYPIEASWSLNRKGTRMRVFWSGATTSRVEIYKNGTRVARTRNDGQWNDRYPTSGATYVVCNDRSTTACSGDLP